MKRLILAGLSAIALTAAATLPAAALNDRFDAAREQTMNKLNDRFGNAHQDTLNKLNSRFEKAYQDTLNR
jgi:Spy/CpxP family protein refolding chaperone